MSNVTEIAPDIFRISTYVPASGMQFNQFLIRDEQPLLYHTLQKVHFDDSLSAVKSLIDIKTLRWIGFSHYEADECGSLNEWLDAAPSATPIAGILAAATSVNNYSQRTPRVLEDGATLDLGRHRLRFLVTPYVPHSWESSLLYDETERVLFCSDVLLQRGDPQPIVENVLDRAVSDFKAGQDTPFHDAIPYTQTTARVFARLAALQPQTLAIMHGASFKGDGASVLRQFHQELKRMLATSGSEAAGEAGTSPSPAHS